MIPLSTSGWQYRSIYRPSFYRHLNHLVINGFYARDLDADDHAFLEQVRVRGIANGELPSYDAVSLEELGFWQLPYTIQPGVERKAGPAPRRIPETPEQRQHRLLRSSAWRARRAIGKMEKELAAAELERERLEWEKADATRKLRAAITDAEWEAAAPKIRYGKIEKRHFVPQWKLDERGELNKTDAITAKKRAKEARRRKREALKLLEAKERAARTELGRLLAKQVDRFNREQAARINAEMLERAKRSTPSSRPDAASLKAELMVLLRYHSMTFENLIRVTGCADRDFMNTCLTEMVRDGQLRNVGKVT